MTKRITLFFTLLMVYAIGFSQTIVGTDPENKNVVLEEFTGIHCVFCPDGHAIAQSIYDAHPDDVLLVYIHQGSFATPSGSEPDFRTQWGNAIAGQSGLTGYPAGTVNRHLFSGWSQGSGTAMSRNYWTSASNQGVIAPEVVLKNYGVNALTTLTFKYTMNGGEEATFDWTGNLAQNEWTMVTLPEIAYDVLANNTLNIHCEQPDGEVDQLPQNDSFNSSFEQSQYYPEAGYFGVQTLGDPQDVTWNLTDGDGTVIAEGGPYSTPGLQLEAIAFPEDGCYTLTLNDASGQGLSGGFYIITDESTNVLWTGPAFNNKVSAELAYDSQVGLNEVDFTGEINIFPNPIADMATMEFNLNSNVVAEIGLYDLVGRNIATLYQGQLTSGHQSIPLNTHGINSGVYFVKIKLNNQTVIKKVIIG